MADAEAQKVFVKQDNMAAIKCPYCKSVRTANVAQYKDQRKVLKVKCACQKVFSITFEFRRMYRKPTNLPGTYVNVTNSEDRGRMVVKNVSMGGIGFSAAGKHRIQKDDELEVEFVLDDKHKSVIRRNVVARMVTPDFVGCEFSNPNEYNKALGFYLMP